MGGRYFISGVQLGMLRAFSAGSIREERYDAIELIDSIINGQFIGNIEDFKNPRIVIQEYHKSIPFFPYESEIDFLKATVAFQNQKLKQIKRLTEQKYLDIGEGKKVE